MFNVDFVLVNQQVIAERFERTEMFKFKATIIGFRGWRQHFNDHLRV
jgi:hypothetical protein